MSDEAKTAGTGAPLKFEAYISTANYKASLDELEKKIMEFSDKGTESTKSIDKAMEDLGATISRVPDDIKKTTQALKEQKDIIKQIEKDISTTENALDKIAPGRDKLALSQELNAQKRALQEEKAILAEIEQQQNKTSDSTETYRTKIRKLTEEMARMELAGKRNTVEYQNLSTEASALKDAISDVYQQTRILANDEAGFEGVIGGIAGITGGFAAAQGVMGLFNAENENLVKIQTKVQSLMAITVGLQQVAQTLNKDSAFSVAILSKAKLGWAKSLTYLNTQLGISIGLSKALLAGGIGLLIAGVGLLIAKISQWRSEQAKTNELHKKFEESTQKAAVSLMKEKAEIESLRSIMRSANATYDEKVRAINQLKSIIPGYNALLSKEGTIISENKLALDEYLKSLQRETAMKVHKEKYEILFEAQYNVDEAIKDAEEAIDEIQVELDKTVKRSRENPGTVRPELINMYNRQLNSAQKELSDLKEERQSIFNDIEKINNSFSDSLKSETGEIPLTLMEFDQLIVEWIGRGNDLALAEARRRLTTENNVKAYINALESAKGDLEKESDAYKKVKKEIDALQKVEDKTPKIIESKVKPFADQLKEIREEYELFYQWIEYMGQDVAENQFASLIKNGDSFLQYVNRQIDDLEAKKSEKGGLTPEEANKLIELNTTKKQLIGDQTELEKFKQEMEEKRNEYASLTEYIEFLNSEIEKLKTFENEISFTKIGIVSNELNRAKDDQKNIFKELLANTESYEQKVTGIKKKYAAMRSELTEASEGMSQEEIDKRMAVLEELQDAEIEAELKASLEKSEIYKKLTQQITQYGRRELQERIAIIKKIIEAERQKAEALGLSTDYLKDLENEVNELMGKLAELGGQSFKNLATGLRMVGDLMEPFNDKLSEALEKAAELADGIGDAVSGIATLLLTNGTSVQGWGQALSGLYKITKSISQMFNDTSLDNVLEDIEDFNKKVLLGQIEVNQLYRERERLQESINESSLIGIQKQIEVLNRQKSLVKSNYDELFRQLTGEQYLDNVGKDRKGFFGRLFGDDYEVIEEWKSLAGKSYAEIEALFYQGRLSEGAEEVFRKLQQLKEEGVDIDQMLEDQQDKLNEMLTGTTADSIAQSIEDGFASGKRSVADFAKDFESMIKNAILSGLSAKVLEPALQKFYTMLASLAEDGLSVGDIEYLKEYYGDIVSDYGESLDLLKQITGISFDNLQGSLSGAIKGVSEDTANIIAGQMNAIRIYQAESLIIERNQLAALQQIAGYTHVITGLAEELNRLKEIKQAIETKKDPLRAKGLL